MLVEGQQSQPLVSDASRRDGSAFRCCRQFCVGDVGIDRAKAGECAETAIGACHYPVGSNDGDEVRQPLGDQFGMLDKIAGGIDHAGYQHRFRRQFAGPVAEHGPFMGMTRVSALEQEVFRVRAEKAR